MLSTRSTVRLSANGQHTKKPIDRARWPGNSDSQVCSSIGRVVVSKTIGWGFESLQTCHSGTMQKLIQYLKDVRSEMAKVSWPTREEIVGGTSLVVVLSVVIAAVVRVFDIALTRVISLVLNM